MPRCNVSYRLIGGRVSQCQASLTFSHLTMEGACYICLRLHEYSRNPLSWWQLTLILTLFFWEGIVTDLWATCEPQSGLLTVSAKAIDQPPSHHLPSPPPSATPQTFLWQLCSVASVLSWVLTVVH